MSVDNGYKSGRGTGGGSNGRIPACNRACRCTSGDYTVRTASATHGELDPPAAGRGCHSRCSTGKSAFVLTELIARAFVINTFLNSYNIDPRGPID